MSDAGRSRRKQKHDAEYQGESDPREVGDTRGVLEILGLTWNMWSICCVASYHVKTLVEHSTMSRIRQTLSIQLRFTQSNKIWSASELQLKVLGE
jgi:hypothetical protein